jgi:hypothetical protein
MVNNEYVKSSKDLIIGKPYFFDNPYLGKMVVMFKDLEESGSFYNVDVLYHEPSRNHLGKGYLKESLTGKQALIQFSRFKYKELPMFHYST